MRLITGEMIYGALLWREDGWDEGMTLRRVSGFVPRMGSCHFSFICPTGISCLSARKLNCWLKGEGHKGYVYTVIDMDIDIDRKRE